MIVNWFGTPAKLMYNYHRNPNGTRLEIFHPTCADFSTCREPTMEEIEEDLKFYEHKSPELDSEFRNILLSIIKEYGERGEW